MSAPRPLAAVSLKAYLSHGETLEWVGRVRAARAGVREDVDLLVVPMATTIAAVARILDGTGVSVGAQDCSWVEVGPFTGELPAEAVRAAGASVVELGHAERRGLFGESDELVAAKVVRAVGAGLTPLLCVGEARHVSVEEAARTCLTQVEAALADVPDGHPVILAYEPVWAIGAEEPAPSAHVRPVCRALKTWVAERDPRSRVLYGGTAGPGVFGTLYPDVDGLFLGRRGHHVSALMDVLEEMSQIVRSASSPAVGQWGGPS